MAEALAAEPYDVAYGYYIRSAETLRHVQHRQPAGPATFLALQLSQYLNTRRLAETTGSPLQRLVFGLESRLIRRYEARIWRDFTRTVLIGPSDLEAVREACRAEGVAEIDNALYGPHGVDIERSHRGPTCRSSPTASCCPAPCATPPTPRPPCGSPARPGRGSGRCGRPPGSSGRSRPAAAVQSLDGRDGITVTGTVPDPADWMAKAAVCVAPIRAAAGLQNKLLEYLAMAKAVVATRAANEGIGALPGRDLVTADEPESTAEAVLALLADPDRAAALGEAGRRFIVASWTWEAHFYQLEAAFVAAADDRVRAGQPAMAASSGLATGPA